MIDQQPKTQVAGGTENASFEADGCLGMTPGFTPACESPWTCPTPQATQNNSQEMGSLEFPTQVPSHGFQFSEYGMFNGLCDPPMSFRQRHQYLHGVYSSHQDPALMTAEEMGYVAQKVGLLMEEVLAWFKDEKSRRTELLASIQHEGQKSTCQFPPSPESTRASGEISSASSSYNVTSPGTPSQSQPVDTTSPCPSSTNQNKSEPPKPKRGRPAKTQVKIEPDLSLPDAKRRKPSIRYPCPDCRNLVALERWLEHINRKHFPEYVWECPKTNRQTGKLCSSSPSYRPSYRHDNFSTHLKAEHDCCEAEVIELKKNCKYEVTDFFHKTCGFCDKALGSRDESIEHIKNHIKEASQEPNHAEDFGVSLWKEKCGVEHRLQLGIHYRKTQISEDESINEDRDNDGDEDKNEDSGESKSDNSGNDKSDFRPANNIHGNHEDGNGHSSKSNSDGSCNDNLSSQSNNHNHSHDAAQRVNQDNLDITDDHQTTDKSPPKDHLDFRCPKMEDVDVPELPSISSILSSVPSSGFDGRPESVKRAVFPTGVPHRRPPRRLTTKEDANFQCPVKGCAKLFCRSYNFTAHMETHDTTREYPFPCAIKDCNKKFTRKTDLQRHHQSVHMKQQNYRCEYCSRWFARRDTLRRHMTDGCTKRYDIETTGVTTIEKSYSMLSRPTGTCREEVDFPMHPNSQSMFPYHDVRGYWPDPSNFSSNASLIDASRCSMEPPELHYSSASASSTMSSVSIATMGSPHSIHGHIVSPPEWAPHGVGLTPSTDSYDNFGPSKEYTFQPSGMDGFALDAFHSSKPNGFVDPSILHLQYTSRPTPSSQLYEHSYPYLPSGRTSVQSVNDNLSSEEYKEKGRCTYPDCGRVFKDLKAHVLTHAIERPEKCPLETCEYHTKGFARKYDKNRHTLTHYKGTMICGFCPGMGSPAEKSFNRADVFKRHLTSVHAVEQTPPNSRKKTSPSGNANATKNLSGYAPSATGRCSICDTIFNDAQEFYEHLDDCVLRIVQQEEPSEANDATRLAEVENDHAVHQTLDAKALLSSITTLISDKEESDHDSDLTPPSRSDQMTQGLTDTKGGVTLETLSQGKKRKDYPLSWGSPISQMKMKTKTIPCCL